MSQLAEFIEKMEQWAETCQKDNLEATFLICARRLTQDHGMTRAQLDAAFQRMMLSLMETDGRIH